MSVWYLESDDEITDAVARLRATEDERVVLVVPPGSRIATGRINFRLLAREAATRKLAFAVVSPDEQVRALAIAGGVVARESVEEAEGALDRGEPPAPAPAMIPEPVVTSAETAEVVTSSEGDGYIATRTTLGGSRRRRVAATSVVILGLILVGGWAGFRFLPSATITIDPDSVTLGPILVTVTASAAAEAIDVTRGEIPAQAISIPLTIEDTFAATGRETTASPARGTVVFSSAEQTRDQEIAARTRISTADGVIFQTTEAVTLRLPSGGPGPAEVQTPVEAVRPGPEGNVPADTITDTTLDAFGISVTNPEPTAGGESQETPFITQADYDAAANDLEENRLAGELDRRVRDPDVVPEELTVFAETAQLGSVEHRPAADELVGTSAPEFELTAVATGTVLAVDESLVDEVTAARLAAEAPAGTALLADTVNIEAGTGTARDDVVNYAARATGTAYAVVDVPALVDRIRGLPVSEARSILEAYGTVSVAVWPDFLGTLPEDADRIDVAVAGPSGSDATDDG